jgi:hypothetical protein
MRTDKGVRLAVSQDKFVWQANAATSEKDCFSALAVLKEVNANAFAYLNAIPVEKWTLYRFYNCNSLFGWRTTNFVESEQAKSLRLKPRMMLPFEYFKSYATILMGDCYRRMKLCKLWDESGRVITPRAETKFQAELKKAEEYITASSSEHVAFVARANDPLTQRRVDTALPECSCSTWKQQRLTCRHLIAALTAHGARNSAIALLGECHNVSAY